MFSERPHSAPESDIRRVSIGSLLCAVLAACQGPANVDGIEADALPVLSISEEFRIGSVDDPVVGFSNIGAVTVDLDGNVYVLELQELEVRVFDQSGTPLRRIGGSGQGPGEFSRPQSIGFRGDTLWVHDPRQRRISMFSPDGMLLTTFPGIVPTGFDPQSQAISILDGVIRSDGLLYAEPVSGIVVLQAGETPPDSVSLPVVRYDRSGAIVDTVGHTRLWLYPEPISPGTTGPVSFSRPRQAELVLDPWPPLDAPLRHRLDDGLILIDRRAPTSPGVASFTVTRTTLAGDTVYHRRFTYEPKAFSPAYVDSLMDARADLDLPDFQSPVSDAQHGDDGTLWLRREVDSGPSHDWIILSPDGRPRGQVELPGNTSIRWVGGDIIYAVERDDFDVPWLVKYRVPG